MRSSSSAALLLALSAFACGGAKTEAQSPEDAAPPATSGDATSEVSGDEAARPSLTAEQCAESGGTVVGDIGDGAIHRPDYRCASGAPPSGSIAPPSAGPVPIEGSVCCPQ